MVKQMLLSVRLVGLAAAITGDGRAVCRAATISVAAMPDPVSRKRRRKASESSKRYWTLLACHSIACPPPPPAISEVKWISLPLTLPL